MLKVGVKAQFSVYADPQNLPAENAFHNSFEVLKLTTKE